MGGFGLLSLVYVVIGIRFIFKNFPRRKEIFAPPLTPQKRATLAEAAFFILVPISVALHELGHAIAIWSMGGEVLDFGFYFFAGFVSYDPSGFSDLQQMVIAFAGTFVNLVLIGISLWIIYRKTPPLTPAWNELLTQFVLISALNSLIIYPLLDLASGMSGDWSQMYNGGVPWMTAVIILVQVGTLAFIWWLGKNQSTARRLAEVTALPAGSQRSILSNPMNQGASQSVAKPPADASDAKRTADRVAKGWSVPVSTSIHVPAPDGEPTNRRPDWTVYQQWQSGTSHREVSLLHFPNGQTSVVGASQHGDAKPKVERLSSWQQPPTEDDLGLALRQAMEQVESW